MFSRQLIANLRGLKEHMKCRRQRNIPFKVCRVRANSPTVSLKCRNGHPIDQSRLDGHGYGWGFWMIESPDQLLYRLATNLLCTDIDRRDFGIQSSQQGRLVVARDQADILTYLDSAASASSIDHRRDAVRRTEYGGRLAPEPK